MTKQLLPAPPYLVLGTDKNRKPVVLEGWNFTQHKLLVGRSGSGKTMLMVYILLSLLKMGIRWYFLDPHGDASRLLLAYLSEGDFFKNPRFLDRLRYYQFNRSDRALAFNILNNPDYDEHTISVNLLDVIKRLFPSSSSTPSMDNVFLSAIHTLIEHKRTFIDIGRLLTDASWRRSLTRTVSEPLVVDFFKNFDTKSGQTFDSALRRAFNLTYPLALQRSLGQSENRLRWRHMLDQTNTSCIFNLSGLDEYSLRFLGALILNGLEVGLKSRSDIPEKNRVPAHILCDEFPLFIQTSAISLSRILDETRKYAGVLYLSAQSFGQINTEMMTSLQNAITLLLQLGPVDSEYAARHWFKKVKPKDQSLFDILFNGWQQDTSPFADAENASDARAIFETTPRAHAILRTGPDPQIIKLPTMPETTTTEEKIQKIEDYYARALLSPVLPPPQEPAPKAAPESGKVKRRVDR